MSETVTVRLKRVDAAKMEALRILKLELESHGLDPRTMTCREDGDDLVYEGARLTQANEAQKRGVK